jgi:hypothetical protein
MASATTRIVVVCHLIDTLSTLNVIRCAQFSKRPYISFFFFSSFSLKHSIYRHHLSHFDNLTSIVMSFFIQIHCITIWRMVSLWLIHNLHQFDMRFFRFLIIEPSFTISMCRSVSVWLLWCSWVLRSPTMAPLFPFSNLAIARSARQSNRLYQHHVTATNEGRVTCERWEKLRNSLPSSDDCCIFLPSSLPPLISRHLCYRFFITFCYYFSPVTPSLATANRCRWICPPVPTHSMRFLTSLALTSMTHRSRDSRNLTALLSGKLRRLTEISLHLTKMNDSCFKFGKKREKQDEEEKERRGACER